MLLQQRSLVYQPNDQVNVFAQRGLGVDRKGEVFNAKRSFHKEEVIRDDGVYLRELVMRPDLTFGVEVVLLLLDEAVDQTMDVQHDVHRHIEGIPRYIWLYMTLATMLRKKQ